MSHRNLPILRKSHSLNIMNKRFIWNFEFDTRAPHVSEEPPAVTHDANRWEARYFWPESQIITIHGLGDSFLNLSQYNYKQRDDTYLILRDRSYNLKLRRDNILYKPFIARTPAGTQYGKKRKYESLDDLLPPEEETLTKDDFIIKVRKEAVPVHLDKEALILKLSRPPKLKLEFARIKLEHQIYFSLSIESKSKEWVQNLSQMLLKNKFSTDYIDFIKNHMDSKI